MIALCGAQQGPIGSFLLNGNHSKAEQYLQQLKQLFPDRFYLELQRAGHKNDEFHIQASVQLAARHQLPVVATHPVQFLHPDDFKAHEARTCIANGYVINDKRRPRLFSEKQHFMTQQQMCELFHDLPEALQNSVEIAKRCTITLNLGTPRLPDFPTPGGQTLEQHLREQAQLGLQQRLEKLYPDESQRQKELPEYQQRLAREVDTIIDMGFPGYFLIVSDFICWAKAYRSETFPNGIPVGPGRGSGAGSLVAYCLGITDLDPLRYELLFERFLNPERVSMPDFDIDFCQDGRELVIDYVKQKYGKQCVSQIATFGTMASKAVIRDVGRVLDFPYGLCDSLSKAIPVEGVKPVSLKKARETEPEITNIAEREEGVYELLELAERLEDMTRNVGMHAGGVLIAPGQLTDFCPLYCADSDGSVVSQYDKDDVEAAGLVKFDFLGLRTLTIIDWAMRHVIRLAGGQAPFDLETLPLDDKATYDLLKSCNTTAVFQLESRGMKELIKRLQPDTFEDIIALVALFRPGPLESGMVEDFINRKHGRAEVDYFHPELEVSLAPTYGVIVYQEQVMQIAQIIGNYTLGGADMLRRAMGKKKPEEMAKQREIFMKGAADRDIDLQLATRLFDLMEKFAGYGFNKSHSAAYALVAYHTAYLKAHHPAAFMAATLSSDLDNTDKVYTFYQDTLQQGININLPDINLSEYNFTPLDEKTLAYGLGAIKGTGEAAINNIVQTRQQAPFTDLFDFCKRIDKRTVNRRTIEALIKAGAFDSINDHRASLMASLTTALNSAEQQARAANQGSLFDETETAADLIEQTADVPRWTLREQLEHEKSSLGFYLGGHPYQEFAEELQQFIKTRLSDLTPAFINNSSHGNTQGRRGAAALIAGIIAHIRIQQSKRGRMAVITLEDGDSRIEMTVFNELFESNRPWLKETELLVVRGKASMDEYSGNVRFTAEELFDFASARSRFASKLRLHCDATTNIAQLRELLSPYREGGICPIVIHYSNPQAHCQIRLGQDWLVMLHCDMLDQLRQTLGSQSVEVLYGNQ